MESGQLPGTSPAVGRHDTRQLALTPNPNGDGPSRILQEERGGIGQSLLVWMAEKRPGPEADDAELPQNVTLAR